MPDLLEELSLHRRLDRTHAAILAWETTDPKHRPAQPPITQEASDWYRELERETNAENAELGLDPIGVLGAAGTSPEDFRVPDAPSKFVVSEPS